MDYTSVGINGESNMRKWCCGVAPPPTSPPHPFTFRTPQGHWPLPLMITDPFTRSRSFLPRSLPPPPKSLNPLKVKIIAPPTKVNVIATSHQGQDHCPRGQQLESPSAVWTLAKCEQGGLFTVVPLPWFLRWPWKWPFVLGEKTFYWLLK